MSSTRPFIIALSASALVVMSACGSSTNTPEASTPSSTTPSASATTTGPSASQPAPAPTGPATVKVSTTKLGEVLTDSRGMVLYKFDPDTAGISTCYEVNDCAAKWPPLLTAGAPTVEAGANAAMLATAPRTDGTTQVTYNKMPLYYFARDAAPGDVKGQGVGGIWWVVSANGTPLKATSPPTS